MTCRDLNGFLMDYLSGELTGGARTAFAAHLDECPPCVAYLESYRETVRLGKLAFADLDAPASREVPPELVKAILAARRAAR
jgi:anti-sigma factor RsiW